MTSYFVMEVATPKVVPNPQIAQNGDLDN